jgi:hypothetical protein
MSKHLTRSTIIAVAGLGLTVPLLAQGRSAVSSAELDASVAARPAANRDAVRGFLATDQVKRVAGRMGLNPSDLSARVATLDQATLEEIAARTGIGDPTLAGGSEKVVISTTVIIIALLIIILVTK